MKTSSTSLFYLIHSLSREEKNYVLRRAIRYRKGGKNILIKLFKAINQSSAETYDEKKLARKIPNLPVRKRELFESILNNLAEREQRSILVIMLGKIRLAAMLHYRKFFPEALALLEEVEEWTKKDSQPYLRGVILQYRSFFAGTDLNKNIELDFENLGNEMYKNAQSILQVTEVFQHYLQIARQTYQTFLFRRDDDIYKLKSLLRAPFLKINISLYALSSQCFFHLYRALLYKLSGDFKSALASTELCWEMMNIPEADFAHRRPQEYFTCFVNYVNACIDANDWTKSKKSITALKKYLDEPNSTFSDGKYYCLNLKYQYCYNRARLRPTIIDEAENYYLQNKNSLQAEDKRYLEYYLLVAYLDQHQFLKAWDYCQSIINAKSSVPRKEFFDAARLLFLLILFEMKKHDELELQCEKVSRYVQQKSNCSYDLEKALIRHFRKITNGSPEASSLRNLQNEIKILSRKNNLPVKQMLHLYDFAGWVKRKLALAG